jgi:HSP20 family molecular chaperone IbpA
MLEADQGLGFAKSWNRTKRRKLVMLCSVMWSAAYNMWEFAQEPTASTAVDVKELPNSFVFVADMPGVKHTEVKVRCPS